MHPNIWDRVESYTAHISWPVSWDLFCLPKIKFIILKWESCSSALPILYIGSTTLLVWPLFKQTLRTTPSSCLKQGQVWRVTQALVPKFDLIAFSFDVVGETSTLRKPWLGIPIFGSNFWDPNPKQNSDSIFDSKDFGRDFFFEILMSGESENQNSDLRYSEFR